MQKQPRDSAWVHYVIRTTARFVLSPYVTPGGTFFPHLPSMNTSLRGLSGQDILVTAWYSNRDEKGQLWVEITKIMRSVRFVNFRLDGRLNEWVIDEMEIGYL